MLSALIDSVTMLNGAKRGKGSFMIGFRRKFVKQ